jgi:hypothetical protein
MGSDPAHQGGRVVCPRPRRRIGKLPPAWREDHHARPAPVYTGISVRELRVCRLRTHHSVKVVAQQGRTAKPCRYRAGRVRLRRAPQPLLPSRRALGAQGRVVGGHATPPALCGRRGVRYRTVAHLRTRRPSGVQRPADGTAAGLARVLASGCPRAPSGTTCLRGQPAAAGCRL